MSTVDTFSEGLRFESQHVATEHSGFVARGFGAFYWRELVQSVPWAALAIAAAYWIHLAMTWRSRNALELGMMCFPVGYFLFLSLSPVQMHRYLLPVIVWVLWLAGMGMAEWIRRSGQKGHRILRAGLTVTAVCLVGWQAWQTNSILHQFRDDSRKELRTWVAANLPAESYVLQETYAGLSFNRQRNHDDFRFDMRASLCIGDAISSLEDARRKGFTHIIVCDLRYARYFDPVFAAAPGDEAKVKRDRALYEQLFHEGELIWTGGPAEPLPGFTNPTVRVYRIQTPQPAAPRTPAS